MKAAVIGAGITGVTTAYYLVKAGYKVEIYDERRYPAMATSYANGGQLSSSNAETWNSWRSVYKGIKWLGQPSAPLKVNPFPSIEKYSWFMRFMMAIPQYEQNTFDTCRMALGGHSLYKQIAIEEDIHFDMVERGILHVYSSKKELVAAEKANEIYTRAGLKRWYVSPEEAKQIEPSIQHANIIGGYYNDTDFTGDIHKFCMRLEKVLETKYGVTYNKTHIKNLNEINSDVIVVCAGTGSRQLASTIGDKIHIYPVKGYSITINNPDVAPWVSLLDDEAKIVSARLGNDRLRVAGTAEFNGYNTDIIQDRIRPLIEWSERMFNGINTEDVKPWAGLRPMTPNMMPIVRKSKSASNVYYNTGHGHLGWTLGAFTAQKIAHQICVEDYRG